MVKITDDYFINLTMDYDKRDNEIYLKWALWCAKSEDRYFIDARNGHFFTHERTEREIAIEKKKRANIEFVAQQKIENEELKSDYEEYVRSLEMDEDFLEKEPKTFEEWSK